MDKHPKLSDTDLTDTSPIELIDRYLSGGASEEEARLALSLLGKAPRLEGILRGDDIVTPPDWKTLSARIAVSESSLEASVQSLQPTPPSAHQTSVHHTSAHKYIRWAAGLAIAVFIGIGGWWSGTGRLRHNLATQVSVFSTAAGKQSHVTLPDGSKVLLNVASTLEVPGDFMTGNKTVHLTGEAMFEVIHHSSIPFVVVTDNSVTQVLGTEFAVKAYQGDPRSIVSVRDGKVSVDNIVVAAGERIIVLNGSKASRSGLTDLSGFNAFAFTSGEISFDDVTLEVAATELERWFDITIDFADPELKLQRISGEFSAKSIINLVDILEGTFGVRASVSGSKVTISKR